MLAKNKLKIGAATTLLLASMSLLPTVANASTQQTIFQASQEQLVNPGYMQHSKLLGYVPSSQAWTFGIALPSKNPSGLKTYAQMVSKPGTPLYHHFLSHQEIMAKFGPSMQTTQQIMTFLKSNNLNASISGQIIKVSTTVGEVNALFQTRLAYYSNGTMNFTAPDSAITIPNALRTALSFTGLTVHSAPVGFHTVPLTSAHEIHYAPISSVQPAPTGSTNTVTAGPLTVTAKLISNGYRSPGMAARYLISVTSNGQPDSTVSPYSISGPFQGAIPFFNGTGTNSNGQFLLDFTVSQQQSISFSLTVKDQSGNLATIQLPTANFIGPSIKTTNVSTLVPGAPPIPIIAPWNPATNSPNTVFQAQQLVNAARAMGPTKLAVFTAGTVSSVSISDVNRFASQFGLPAPNVTVAYTGPHAISSGPYLGPIEGELSLDLQMMETSSPGANIQIYEAGSLRSALNQVVSQNSANVFSISYGAGENAVFDFEPTAQATWNQLAQEANAEGITITVSAGDSAAFEGAQEGYTSPMLSYPANSPYVSAVGGTEDAVSPYGGLLSSAMWGGNIGAELSTPTFLSFLQMQNMTAGGGYSTIESVPTYQRGTVPNNAPGRANPDWSFPASVITPGYFMYFDGQPGLSGGTSASAPLSAGWIADLDEVTGQKFGNINTRIYPLAKQIPGLTMPVNYGNNGVYSVMPFSRAYNPVVGLGQLNVDKLFMGISR